MCGDWWGDVGDEGVEGGQGAGAEVGCCSSKVEVVSER